MLNHDRPDHNEQDLKLFICSSVASIVFSVEETQEWNNDILFNRLHFALFFCPEGFAGNLCFEEVHFPFHQRFLPAARHNWQLS